MAADWARIEADYITNPDTSYRKLAKKYGLNQATIAQKAKADNWASKRKQQAIATQAMILEADISTKVDRAARLTTVADKLLERVEDIVTHDDRLTATAIKNLSDALKNIKEAQMIRSQDDIDEQRARIEKLRREAERDKESTSTEPIRVIIDTGADQYSK